MFILLLSLFACDASPEAAAPIAAPREIPVIGAEPENTAAPVSAEGTHYGAAFTVAEVTPASALLDAPETFLDQTLLVEGRVTEVCQAMGCWMVIADEDRSMRVLMKDHDFSVSKEGAGSDCQVQGVVRSRQLDAEWVEHLASESERPEDMPEKKAEAGVVYELEASGVLLRRGEG